MNNYLNKKYNLKMCEKQNLINILSIINPLKNYNQNIIKNYFEYIFNDLEKNKNNISIIYFYYYLKIPLLIVKKFLTFFIYINNKDNFLKKVSLTKEEFINGMITFYFYDYNNILLNIFNFFDFNKENYIYKDDIFLFIKILLIYKNKTSSFTEFENIFNNNFKEIKTNKISFKEWGSLNQKNSDILILFLFLLYETKPFNEKNILFYINNYYFDNNINKIKNINNNNNKLLINISDVSNELVNFLKEHFNLNLNYIQNQKINDNENFIEEEDDLKELKKFEDEYISTIGSLNINNSSLDSIKSNNSSSENSHFPLIKTDSMEFNCYKIKYSKNKLNKLTFIILKNELFIINSNNKLEKIININRSVNIIQSENKSFKSKNYLSFKIIYFLYNNKSNLKSEKIYLVDIEQENELKKFLNEFNNPKFEDKYNIEKIIGEGGNSKILLGNYKNNNNYKVAIKVLSKSKNKIENIIWENEIFLILSKYNNNNNIIKCIESFENENYIILINEYIKNGNLLDFREKLNEGLLYKITQELINGLYFLHSLRIIHRDIKPENILIKFNNPNNINDFNIKYIDFGLSKMLTYKEGYFNSSGSFDYLSPEIINKKDQNFKCDIWSLGMTLYALKFGKFPFIKLENFLNKIKEDEFKVNRNKYYNNRSLKCKIIKSYNDKICECIEKCLVYDQNKRFSIEQLKKHFEQKIL